MAKTPRVYQSDKNPVGMIVSSMLTEAQFQALNGSTWVLMDGRNIAGSKYATVTGTTALPDARGMALRGANNGGSAQGTRADGFQNPDAPALGAFQDHAFQTHGHNASSSDSGHSHGQNTNIIAGTSAAGSANGSYSPPNVYIAIGNGGGGNGGFLGTAGASAAISTSVSSPNSGNVHGSETRMRNITVNHFIKIND